jgi:hypothetical protein
VLRLDKKQYEAFLTKVKKMTSTDMTALRRVMETNICDYLVKIPFLRTVGGSPPCWPSWCHHQQ